MQKVSKSKLGCGILDLDFLAGFDLLDMAWVYLLLKKEGLAKPTNDRIRNLYDDSRSTFMVNNIKGRMIKKFEGIFKTG